MLLAMLSAISIATPRHDYEPAAPRVAADSQLFASFQIEGRHFRCIAAFMPSRGLRRRYFSRWRRPLISACQPRQREGDGWLVSSFPALLSSLAASTPSLRPEGAAATEAAHYAFAALSHAEVKGRQQQAVHLTLKGDIEL